MGEGMSLALEPFHGFDDGARAVLQLLRERLGFGTWMVIRDYGETGIVLTVDDHGYGVTKGQVCRWTGDLASLFPAQRAIVVTADDFGNSESIPLRDFSPVRAYVGAPLYLTDGDLFGTLCAIDRQPLAASFAAELPLIELSARLLASLFELELKAQRAMRRADRVEAESKLDPLTGLYNRRGWETLFEREEARCQRYGSSGAVVSLDLDDLKKINDADGHAAGDRLIAAAARCLTRAVRNTDVVARLGGDEFGVLLVEARGQDADTLLERIRTRFAIDQINVSAGCAVRDPMSTLYDTLARADEAMYAEKKRRKAVIVA